MFSGRDAPQASTSSNDAAATDSQGEATATSTDAIATLSSNDPTAEAGSHEKNEDGSSEMDDFHPGLRLWVIILGLGVTLLLTALENTVVTVAAPMIISDLQLGENYIWVTNAFFICSAAIQPLVGQLCNVFGRRYNMLSSVAIFTLGSGICGGAKNAGMLIAGRAIQGLGSGGITLLNDIIVSDLVPLRKRGNYIGVILVIYGVGTTLGPFIGGSIVATTTWRWIFYLNIPIGSVSLLLLSCFLQVNYKKDTTFAQKMQRIDFVGNAVLIASTVSVLYALAYAGASYSWASWHILVPLLLGFLGFFLFAYTQGGRFAAAEPVMPPRLFHSRTSVIVSINTFINSALTFWGVFFLPVFFQAAKLYGPQYSGVALLPMSLVAIPGAALAAVAISRWGRYKPVHIAGFAVFMLGLGLFTLQNPHTTVAQWASYQCVAALGGGVLLNSQLPAFQNGVPERDQAAASATWGFIRSIGWVWGVAIPASIFNNRVSQLIGEISDPAAAEMMASGGAYGAASAAQVKQFALPVQAEIRSVYAQAVQRVFQISIAFAGVGFLLSLAEHEIMLREKLETEYGLKHENDRYNRAKPTTNAEKGAAI
ncbi:MFS general substrate transporter [Cryphonectria parasitica EP155]|uniref:MFS general substrate transporter n=1 Tax=Cryphonectria parasitica (strain ATCC 38755 / EP155) TaxID=660469 RepID=A0A9P5CL77_CRYP1|nr:MFS general substrate transporter [Cryphonectria parasitica EP155]KAF3763039.1 MFS general substrate transporter [Cryphonectria parasitica EP155]